MPKYFSRILGRPSLPLRVLNFDYYCTFWLTSSSPQWPEFQHRSDYPDHPIPANQIRWDTIVPACQRWTSPRGLFSIRCRIGNSRGKGVDQFELESMFNQLLPGGQSLPLLRPHDGSIPYLVLRSLNPTIRHRLCFSSPSKGIISWFLWILYPCAGTNTCYIRISSFLLFSASPHL